MVLQGSIQNFPKEIRILILVYLVVTSIGFVSALQFVNTTTEGGQPKGIEENYLGNEDDLEAIEMKFAKSEKQILNIVHAHMLSMGMLFLILALLVATTPLKGVIRKLLLFEPLISVLLTFGGIYFLWKGMLWMKYVIMISGIAMTLSYVVSVLVVGYCAIKSKNLSD
ncbi:hypothetical protein ACOKFD_09130 [Flagellimonas sp. S174]|uniref:hypothetical protein n=1 Tax=Flagellimonas sp. S174 TaxID=3410790 RepID=UPI003BF52E85